MKSMKSPSFNPYKALLNRLQYASGRSIELKRQCKNIINNNNNNFINDSVMSLLESEYTHAQTTATTTIPNALNNQIIAIAQFLIKNGKVSFCFVRAMQIKHYFIQY